MDNRRDFIKKSVILCAWASLPVTFSTKGHATVKEFKTHDPQNVLILHYSQSGFTTRYGRLMACQLKDKGLAVDISEMKGFDQKRLCQYDLILIGSPVFYYDIPANVSRWLAGLPKITGIPVAAYVSFGGPEGNQHNALCHALRLLSEAGGIPVGMDAFRSIPAYPTPNWDSANQRSGEHLPNEATYEQVRQFIRQVLENTRRGKPVSFEPELAVREALRILPLSWFNKKAINKHTVDSAKCILCRTCVKKCPADAIDPEKRMVDRDKCLTCFGCLNNCPASAVIMEYTGKRLYGFPEYLRRRKIAILEPPEFQTCKF